MTIRGDVWGIGVLGSCLKLREWVDVVCYGGIWRLLGNTTEIWEEREDVSLNDCNERNKRIEETKHKGNLVMNSILEGLQSNTCYRYHCTTIPIKSMKNGTEPSRMIELCDEVCTQRRKMLPRRSDSHRYPICRRAWRWRIRFSESNGWSNVSGEQMSQEMIGWESFCRAISAANPL